MQNCLLQRSLIKFLSKQQNIQPYHFYPNYLQNMYPLFLFLLLSIFNFIIFIVDLELMPRRYPFLQLLPQMRTMNITRMGRDIKTRGLQSRMDTGQWKIEQKDELMVKEVISISNHDFCAKREKYTKEIREELDPRDKKYIFPFETTFNITQYLTQRGAKLQQNSSNQQENTKDIVGKKSEEYLKLQRTIFNYISEVSQNVSSIAFRLLSKGQLTDGQVKAFAVQTILANIQSVLTEINSKLEQYADREKKAQTERQFDDLMEKLTKAIDEELSQIFAQLAGHYPQAPAAGTTASMREVINDLNRVQDEENNLIFSSGIKIGKYVEFSIDDGSILNKPQDQTGFVMEVINQAIEITRTVVDQDLTLFQKFQQFNEKLFAFTSTERKMQNLIIEGKRQLGSLTTAQKVGIFHKVLQAKKTKQQYKTLQQNKNENKATFQFQQRIVQQYKKDHKFLVAQKIPNHVKQFSHAEIIERSFKVNNSSVLRIMTKWVESLQDIFQKAEQEIGGRKNLFKDIHNNLITYQIDQRRVMNSKQRIIYNLKAQYEDVKKQLEKLKEENALFQSYILSEKEQQFSCLKRFNKVREASAQINAIVIEYTKKYLCILIHYLIKAGHFDRNLVVNLVVFRVGDLLRSKLQCSERDFINVMNMLQQLDNSKAMEQKFKLVRIKNKLNMRDNNVLINYMFMNKVQCELQLSVQKMDDRDKHYYDFCHFLYQLMRGKFGVLTECAIVACQHDSIINSSRDGYYRPKCYEIMQRKKKIHKINEKDKDIYKCIKCGQLKMGENTQLFQKESQCNMCIVKQDGVQKKMKDKIGFLSDKERIRNYVGVEAGDCIILVKNQNADAVLKLYKAWRPEGQIKLFLVEINEDVLREFQKPGFKYEDINYFNILSKKKKQQNLKELTYNIGKNITVQVLQSIGIYAELFQNIDLFFKDNQSYRTQKNLIKQIELSGFINADNSRQKWEILKKILQAYQSGDLGQLRYQRYKRLDWMHIKGIELRQNGIESVRQLFQLTHGCKRIEIGSNQMTQVYLDKLEKLQYLNVWQNNISSIDLRNNPLLTELHLGCNPLTELRLNCHPNLQALYAIGDRLQHVDVSSCINLKNLQLGSNKLKEIDLSSCINLETISLNSNQLQQIIIGCSKRLKKLGLYGNNLKQLDVSQNLNLKSIDISGNQFENVNFQGNPKLKRMDLEGNSNLRSVKLWSSLLTSYDSPLYGVSSKCRLTVLYRKQDSQKHNKVLAQLRSKYNKFVIQSEERN